MTTQTRSRKAVSLSLGLFILVGMGVGCFFLLRSVVEIVTALDSDVAVAVITAAATVFVSVLSIVLGKIYESKALIRKENRDKKIPVYEELMAFVFKILQATKRKEDVSEAELIAMMMNLNQRAMIWGSDGVLAAWGKWRRHLTDEATLQADPVRVMFLYEELVFAIRKDLGHSNRGLGKGDILVLFINDIDQYLAPTS